MSGWLLDTSAVIGLLERQSRAIRSLVAASSGDLYVSVITVGELEHGVAAAADPASSTARRRSIDTLASSANVLDTTHHDAAIYGALSAELRAAGVGPRIVGTADRWIASSAIRHRLTLVTQDRQLAAALAASSFAHDDLVLLAE